MPWIPDPDEPSGSFEGQVVENVLTILTRDFKQALDHYYPLDNLPDFAELELGPPLRNVFPCASIEPIRSTLDASDDNSFIAEVGRVRVYVAVTGDGPKVTTRKLFKYVRVLHLLLQNSKNDFRTGMSNPHGVVLGEFEHAYDVVRSDNTTISRAAAVEISIGMRER